MAASMRRRPSDTLTRMWRVIRGAMMCVVVMGLPAPASAAADPVVDGAGGAVTVTLPLVPVPLGCTAPEPPHVVFVGQVVDRDARAVRFLIESVRDGDPAPYSADGLIDVRYGLDAQYLDDGERYLVGTGLDPDLGVLVSRIDDPIEDFGGDEVLGVSDSDVDCPEFEDPIRTLHLDGSAIEGGVLAPFLGARVRIVAAVMVPLVVAFGAVFLLASLRLSLAGMYRGIVRPRRR
jgi:hypothetical protein